MEPLSDRLSAFLRRRGKVFFQIKKEDISGPAGMETVRMFDPKGMVLGHITFETTVDHRVLIQAFHVEDWGERRAHPRRLLKWFIDDIRRRDVTSIEGSLYGLSASGHDVIMLLKGIGFEMMELGTLTGRSEYAIRLVL